MPKPKRYRVRGAEPKLLELAAFFKVVLVAGARQVGKSTLLEHVFPDIRVVVFDPVQDIAGARRDPDLFLDTYPPPLILDEVQYAPELLPALKRRVDRLDEPGSYFLTGSQNLSVLRTVAESMAGRVGILHLDGMTPDEMTGHGHEVGWLGDYLEAPDELPSKFSGLRTQAGALTRFLWRGCLPGLLDLPDAVVPDYFRSYVSTYVERDVRLSQDIRNLAQFDRFLGLAAALTAQEINASQLGRDVGVTPKTSRSWLDTLTHTYQWLELFAYHGNTVKRLSRKRKGYLCDTGLACYLQRISSPEALSVSPLLGPLFETWAVNFLIRQFVQLATPPQMYHWRTTGGGQVDVVLERDGRLFPIEMRATANLSGHAARGIGAFRATYPRARVEHGLVIYAGDTVFRLNKDVTAVPWNVCKQ